MLRTLKACQKRRRALDQLDSLVDTVASNLLGRQFEATGPNQESVANFTYIRTGDGGLVVAVVFHLHSQGVGGWSMQPTMTAQLVVDSLRMAFFRHCLPRALLHHSHKVRDTRVRISSGCSSCTVLFEA